MATAKKKRRKKPQTAAAKIRALSAAGVSKEEIMRSGPFTRQQVDGAIQHPRPAGRPRKPRCSQCGAILKKVGVKKKALGTSFVVLATTNGPATSVEPLLRELSDELLRHLEHGESLDDSGGTKGAGD